MSCIGTLGASIENLTMESGFGNINGVGNELDNAITGNRRVNRLAETRVRTGFMAVPVHYSAAANDIAYTAEMASTL